MKASFVLQAATIAGVALLVPATATRVSWLKLAATMTLAVALAAPSGYVANLARWGRLVGPQEAIEAHTFAGVPLEARVTYGARNVVFLATDFVSLDGLPRVTPVLRAQAALRRIVMAPLQWANVDVTGPAAARSGFLPDRPVLAHEAHAYWGVAGLLLIWPAVLAAAVSRRPSFERALAWGVILFLVLQAFSGPYDSFRGRYFLSSAVLGCPLCVRWFRVRGTLARAYVCIALALTICAGLASAFFRSAAPLVSLQYAGVEHVSILRRDRSAQLARNWAALADVFRELDRLVPLSATVAVCLPPDSFEYPIFGPRLQRRVVPVGGRALTDPAVAAADYLVFSEALETPRAGDVRLGEDWWLRRVN